MTEPSLIEIATQTPRCISGKHLKGLTLDELMKADPLLPNYTLRVKVRDERITRAKYLRRDDGQSALETMVVTAPVQVELNEKNVYLDGNKNFRTLRRMYNKLPLAAQERFKILFRFTLAEMQVELARAGKRRSNE